MTPSELLHKEAVMWLEQAARDLNAARALASPEASRSVFHSQQAAEKALKAFLTFHQTAFRKTHDLTQPGSHCASLDPTLEPLLREAEGLTDYASLFRYPDAPYEPDVDEALRAIEIAGQLCATVRSRIDHQITAS